MISMFDAAIPPFLRALGALDTVLAKGAEHCEANGIEPSALLTARLYPNMFPFTRQVQTAADGPKLAAFRLTGQEPPKHPDIETSFAELQARVATVRGLLAEFRPEQFDGAETRAIAVPTGRGPLHFSGLDYLQAFALPNLYFHVTTAYDILRHNGVVLGKRDFLGPMPV